MHHALETRDKEQAYLDDVFRGKTTAPSFSATPRHAELLVPVQTGGKLIVLRFAVNNQ